MVEAFSREQLDAIEAYEASQDKYHLSNGQYIQLQEAFTLFDNDKSGQISVTELQSVMATLGHAQTAQEMEEIMYDRIT